MAVGPSPGYSPQQYFDFDKIRLQDVVSPEVINSNFEKVRKYLCVDYISDDGSKSYEGAIWRYKRFNSGFTIFNATYTFPQIDINIDWDGIRSSPTLRFPGYTPFLTAGIDYYNFNISKYQAVVNDPNYWRFLKVDAQSQGFTHSGGHAYPPSICVYWNSPSSYNLTLKKVEIQLFGVCQLN